MNIQALDNYNKALSQLSLDEGSTLQRLSHQHRGEVGRAAAGLDTSRA